jgi:hypothetical protein
MKFKENLNWNIFSLKNSLQLERGLKLFLVRAGENIANYLKKFILFQFKNKFSNFHCISNITTY